LEDTLEAFRQTVNQPFYEIKDATMVNCKSTHEIKDTAMLNTEAIARLEGQLGHLVAEFNIVEEVVKETVNEPSQEDPLEACLAQSGDDLELDKSVHEHIMDMRDIATQLKSLEIEILESFLVNFILNSLPDTT
jgi:hypothetical protein